MIRRINNPPKSNLINLKSSRRRDIINKTKSKESIKLSKLEYIKLGISYKIIYDKIIPPNTMKEI